MLGKIQVPVPIWPFTMAEGLRELTQAHPNELIKRFFVRPNGNLKIRTVNCTLFFEMGHVYP